MINVFIDGKEGTTGLQIFERLGKRDDIRISSLSEKLRKDLKARKEQINAADIVFLCLPDAAARESVSLCENKQVKIIDASTAHRTDPSWAYGFPELSEEHRKKIAVSRRVAVPGCHASGSYILSWRAALYRPIIRSSAIRLRGTAGAEKR